MNGRVLVVDDEKNITLVLKTLLERAHYEVVTLNDSSLAFEVIGSEDFDVVISDLNMPEYDGFSLLDHCRKNAMGVPVIIITAYGTVDAAVNAIKRGAFDFITKPFDQNDLLSVVKKAISTFRRQEGELSEPFSGTPLSKIMGESALMQEVYRVISKVSATSTTVLIQGESGTGKELVAYEIHRQSNRANKAFVKVNCGAIHSSLIESELFGHEKGAFTGAIHAKPGRFELAHEGTLFLDEVGEMPLDMQVKLLRVLQQQEFERVGGVVTRRVDVRIIAATHRDLQQDVQNGRFREDLFYRLNVFPIRLPALRERKEDIDFLLPTLMQQLNKKLNRSLLKVHPYCRQVFESYVWPGNVRQFENVIERMILLSDTDELSPCDLPEELGRASQKELKSEESGNVLNFKEHVRFETQKLERTLIEKVLADTNGNITHSAEKLGLSRKGLQLKMKELGLKRPLDE